MWKKCSTSVLAGSLLLVPGTAALGYIDSVEIEPSNPDPGEPFAILVAGATPTPCDTLAGHSVAFAENEIRVTVDIQMHPGICIDVIAPFQLDVPVEGLGPGRYRVVVTDPFLSQELWFRVGGEQKEVPMVRGDANVDREVDLSDAVTILGYLYSGDPEPPCLEAMDADSNGELELTDAVYLLGFSFQGGPPPEPPFPICGVGAAEPKLSCRSYSLCK